jgi:hypothetical protein
MIANGTSPGAEWQKKAAALRDEMERARREFYPEPSPDKTT